MSVLIKGGKLNVEQLQCYTSKIKLQKCVEKNPDKLEVCYQLKNIFKECMKDANVVEPRLVLGTKQYNDL